MIRYMTVVIISTIIVCIISGCSGISYRDFQQNEYNRLTMSMCLWEIKNKESLSRTDLMQAERQLAYWKSYCE